VQPEGAQPNQAVLLVEYQKAQDSAQFHDQITWASTAVTWALSGAMLNFGFNHICQRIPTTFVAVVGIFIVCFQSMFQASSRSIKLRKYERCKSIERILGMTQHSTASYVPGAE